MSEEIISIKDISKGFHSTEYSHLFIVNEKTYTWGSNKTGQCGILSYNNCIKGPSLLQIPNRTIKKAWAMGDGFFILTTDNSFYIFGANQEDQFSTHITENEIFSPTKFDLFERSKIQVNDIICGYNHTFCISDNLQVFAWGTNQYGQLGLGDFEDRVIICKINFQNNDKIAKLYSGQFHTFSISDNGNIYTWGRNEYGQLGLGNFKDRCIPQKFSFFQKANITPNSFKSVVIGADHTIIMIDDNKSFYGWVIMNMVN